jgi:3-oxoacyl-[acyl-carrier protein] reductase
MIDAGLNGKVALVTGANHGIGAATARALASQGAAAHELGQFGITVNIVSPGPIQTDWISPDLEAALLPTIPLGRIGQPDDVADVIVFLASHQARWLTGQTLHVGGGHRML